MAFKYDKPYRTNINIEPQKITDLFNLVYQMDTQEIMQYALINKIELGVTLPINGNNLIHEILLNNDKLKNEFNKLNVIKFLVQNDVNPDEPNRENRTPIHIACEKQLKDIVNYLITECQVNINYADNNGYTPLHYLFIGEINLFNKKEITNLITQKKDNDKKGDNEKKNSVLDIKKKIHNIISKIPFMKSLDNSINRTVKNNSEIQEILSKNYDIIYKKILSTENVNVTKENTLSVILQRNDINKVVKKIWGNFSNTDRLTLHTPQDNSYIPDGSKQGIIKNCNIKRELKENILTNVTNFETYIKETLDIKNIIKNIDGDKMISDIYNKFHENIDTKYFFKNNNHIKLSESF